MIYKIHYFAFNAGLSGILTLITVFLRRYSDASSTEVGTLLMVLPFIAVFSKPFFCALADRHRRYRLYFLLSLVFTLLGFGSYVFLPFFPQFIAANGRASWYLLVVCTVIGYIAYGVAWSMGDAYAANQSRRTGESFGMIRLWGTVGWGCAGAIVGSVAPYLALPEMVLGVIICIITFIFEIILLSWWPHEQDFEMGDAIPSHGPEAISEKPRLNQAATITEKPSEPVELVNDIQLALSQVQSGQVSITRTQSNSLAITTKVKLGTNRGDNLEKAISKLVLCSSNGLPSPGQLEAARLEEARNKAEREKVAELQMTILKMVTVKHKSLIKYLIIYVALGTVYNIHWSYFFLHLERLSEEGKGGDFSTLVGACLVSQAVGETFCFMIAPWVVGKLGRDGAISLNAITYAIRYFGNGLGIPMVSPWVAVLTESLQGINYGIFYYLITDTAMHFACLVDDVIPELYERELIDGTISELNAVRTSLRVTMQGVFSGAFDGLGFGLGSLIAGLVLEKHKYEELWCYTGAAALVIFALHAIYELSNRYIRRSIRKRNTSGCLHCDSPKLASSKPKCAHVVNL